MVQTIINGKKIQFDVELPEEGKVEIILEMMKGGGIILDGVKILGKEV